MMRGNCTKCRQCVLIWKALWLGTLRKKRGTALATGLDSTGLGKWSMDLRLQIYLLRKSLRRIKPIRTIVHRSPHNSTPRGNDVGFPTLIHPAPLSELKDVRIDSSHTLQRNRMGCSSASICRRYLCDVYAKYLINT